MCLTNHITPSCIHEYLLCSYLLGFCIFLKRLDCDSSKNERPKRENAGRYFDDDIPGTYLPIAEKLLKFYYILHTSHDLWPITLHYDHHMKHYLLSFIITTRVVSTYLVFSQKRV